MLRKLWRDESGGVVSTELVLIGSALATGLTAAMSSARDTATTELADLGAAISQLDQSYTLHGSVAPSAATASTFHRDRPDQGDGVASGTGDQCVVVCGS